MTIEKKPLRYIPDALAVREDDHVRHYLLASIYGDIEAARTYESLFTPEEEERYARIQGKVQETSEEGDSIL